MSNKLIIINGRRYAHSCLGDSSGTEREFLLRVVGTERATAQHILRKHIDAPGINFMSQLKSLTTLTR